MLLELRSGDIENRGANARRFVARVTYLFFVNFSLFGVREEPF